MLALAIVQLLISTDALANLQDTILIDTRSIAQYSAGHIPGAINLVSASFAEERNGVQGLLRPVQDIVPELGQAGVDPEKHVVLYAANKSPDDFIDASRMFWILDYLGYPRVSILDGGFNKWTAENRPVQTESVTLEPVTVSALAFRPDRLASKKDVMELGGDAQACIADLRSSQEFAGAAKKPFVGKAGHIPGAQSLPATGFVEGDLNTLKSLDDLRAMVALKSDAEKRRIITYCNTGRSASVGYFVYRLLGEESVALYDGSMAEWGNAPDTPVVTGDK